MAKQSQKNKERALSDATEYTLEGCTLHVKGHLGRDVEAGKGYVYTSLAVYTGKDEPPFWLNVRVWDTQGDERFAGSKGDFCAFAGRLSSQEYKGEQKLTLNVNDGEWEIL